jgi:hypothetical protein
MGICGISCHNMGSQRESGGLGNVSAGFGRLQIGSASANHAARRPLPESPSGVTNCPATATWIRLGISRLGSGEQGCQTACKPGSVRVHGLSPQARDGHSSGTRLTARLSRPTRAARRECLRGHGTKWGFVPRRRPPLFGLAPGGVCPATPVTGGAVRSYRTISPLPAGPSGRTGGMFSVALSLGLPPPAVSRHRIPVEPGLSSPA